MKFATDVFCSYCAICQQTFFPNLYWDFNGWACNPVPGPQDAQRRVAIIVTTVQAARNWRVSERPGLLPMWNLTLVFQILKHIEISEHLTKFAEKLIIEHLFYTISIATNKEHPAPFSHSENSQTRLTIRDTGLVSSTITMAESTGGDAR